MKLLDKGDAAVPSSLVQAEVPQLCPWRQRHLQWLVTNTFRSLQALEGKLTAEEVQTILDAIRQARNVGKSLQLDELRGGLTTMERAAGIIGQAMLRP